MMDFGSLFFVGFVASIWKARIGSVRARGAPALTRQHSAAKSRKKNGGKEIRTRSGEAKSRLTTNVYWPRGAK